MDRETRQSLKNLGGVASLGFSMPISIFLGLGFGYVLDRWCGTRPAFTLFFLILGIIAAFLTLYREVKRVQ